MKVLHVAECVGGVDRYLRCLLKYSNCENIVILSQLYNKNEYENLVKTIDIMNMNHKVGLLSTIKETVQLRRKIRKYNPDIVYAHSSIAGAITRIACVFLSVKVIYNPHGWSFNMESKKKNIYIILERFLGKFCDAIVCISDAEKISAINAKICKESKLHVIYNGIDMDECKNQEVNINLPFEKNAFVVGMVGRICRQKAPDIFVKMASEVQKQIPNACFVIVGDVLESEKKEKEEIEDLARELGVKLFITGWVNNPLSYMEKFDVGCLLSRWEGFGLAIPEYMITNTPVVASEVDAIPFLIKDGENGMLVEKDDWLAAAEKVVELARNNEKRETLKKNGMETVKQRFDFKRVAKESEELYKELLK